MNPSRIEQLQNAIGARLRQALPALEARVCIEDTGPALSAAHNEARRAGPLLVVAVPPLIFKESAVIATLGPAMIFDALLTIAARGGRGVTPLALAEAVIPALHAWTHGLARPGTLVLDPQAVCPAPTQSLFADYIPRYASGGRERFRRSPVPGPDAKAARWWLVFFTTELALPAATT